MKALFLFSAIFLSTQAFAGNDCREVKTAYHIYKAQKSIVGLANCKTPMCVVRKTKSTEKNFCKAVNACGPMADELHYPCTEDDKLTAEAKENVKKFMHESIERVIEYIKSIKRDKSGYEEFDFDENYDGEIIE